MTYDIKSPLRITGISYLSDTTKNYVMTNVNEIWRPVKGYENLYEISNLGRVKSLPRLKTSGAAGRILTKERYLKPCINEKGYYLVVLSKPNEKKRSFNIHRLIMESFIPNPNNLPAINHINGIKTDNSLENLEWCTFGHNNRHAIATGLNTGRGTKIKQICIQTGEVIKIFKSAKDAEKETGASRSVISCVANKKRSYKTAGGYRWEFA